MNVNTKTNTLFSVFSSHGKEMNDTPFYSRQAAENYAEQLRLDFVEDVTTMFFVEEL